jgi:predicted transposase/invertase (TIGR01784 family)
VSILEKEQPEVVTEFIRWLYAHFEDPVPQWVDEIRTLKEVPTMLATAIKKKEQEWFKEGLMEGRIEERRETARRMKARGIELDIIAEVTGLSREEIEEL